MIGNREPVMGFDDEGGDLYDMDLATEIVAQSCAVEGEPSVRFLRVIAEYEASMQLVLRENAA